jgi:hypothetical protein
MEGLPLAAGAFAFVNLRGLDADALLAETETIGR